MLCDETSLWDADCVVLFGANELVASIRRVAILPRKDHFRTRWVSIRLVCQSLLFRDENNEHSVRLGSLMGSFHGRRMHSFIRSNVPTRL